MNAEDKSLDDCDGPASSFRGATLRIQHESSAATADAAVPSLPDCQTSNDAQDSVPSTSGGDVSPSEIKSGTHVAALPWSEDHIKNLFSSREGLVDQAVKTSSAAFVIPDLDGEVLGSWIMTEINIWDAEKERLVLLTSNSLLVIKFDFIALRPLEVRRTSLQLIDTIVIGNLVYPPASLVPARNMRGLRVMWNNGEPITFSKKWNPFNNDIPFLTFTSHPLLWHKEACQAEDIQSEKTPFSYNVESLSQQLLVATAKLDKPSKTIVQYKPILLHNYLSFGSLIHNRNSLGFFKVRGRFSF